MVPVDSPDSSQRPADSPADSLADREAEFELLREQARSLEEEVVLHLDLSVARRDGREIGLEDLVESERYLASAVIEAHRKNRDEALRRVAVALASRFFDALGESLRLDAPASVSQEPPR